MAARAAAKRALASLAEESSSPAPGGSGQRYGRSKLSLVEGMASSAEAEHEREDISMLNSMFRSHPEFIKQCVGMARIFKQGGSSSDPPIPRGVRSTTSVPAWLVSHTLSTLTSSVTATYWANLSVQEREAAFSFALGGKGIRLPSLGMPLSVFIKWAGDLHAEQGRPLQSLLRSPPFSWSTTIGIYYLDCDLGERSWRRLGWEACLDEPCLYVVHRRRRVAWQIPDDIRFKLREIDADWKLEENDSCKKANLRCRKKYICLTLEDLFAQADSLVPVPDDPPELFNIPDSKPLAANIPDSKPLCDSEHVQEPSSSREIGTGSSENIEKTDSKPFAANIPDSKPLASNIPDSKPPEDDSDPDEPPCDSMPEPPP